MIRRAWSVPPWVTITVLSLCGLVAALQFTLVIPLLPEFPELLEISAADSSWLVTATLLTSAVSTPIVARMADMYGKRRMLVVALLAMVLGSVICALAGSFLAMIVGRALQGLGSSLIAVGISILRDELPPARMGTAVALMSATMGIGSALGLPLSGVLTSWLGWHSVFWFGAVAGAVLIVCLFALVNESRVRTPGRFDLPGALLLSAGLVCLLLPISKGSIWGWDAPQTLGLFALAMLLFGLWVPLELRVNQPMVDVRTAALRPVLATNIASAFAGLAMFANMLVTVQLLQLPSASGFGFGLSITAAGLAMVPSGLAMAVLSPFSGAMLNRWGGRPVLITGLAMMAIAYAGRVVLSNSVAEVIIGSTLVGIGTALAFAAMPMLIMSSVPITETAAANGLNSLVRSIGTSCASAMVAAILAASTLEVAGRVIPSQGAFHAVLWLGAITSALGAGLAFLIPAEVRTGEKKVVRPRPAGTPETVISGRILLGGSGTVQPAVVAVHDLAGTQLDWARPDNDGRWSLALPGPGTYVMVGNAVGWAPSACVLDFTGTERDVALRLSEELTVSGTVTSAGTPCPGAVVALTEAAGGQIATTICDEAGRYRFPLPPIGRYTLTAIDPENRRAAARKAVLAVQSAVIDLDLT